MDVADDVLGRLLIDWQTRILILSHPAHDLIEARIHRDGDDGVAWNHDFPHIVVRELEQSLDGIFLESMQVPFETAGADNEL